MFKHVFCCSDPPLHPPKVNLTIPTILANHLTAPRRTVAPTPSLLTLIVIAPCHLQSGEHHQRLTLCLDRHIRTQSS